MPGTGARANELHTQPQQTHQPLRPGAGLLQTTPIDTASRGAHSSCIDLQPRHIIDTASRGAHPLCPERVPERMNYTPNPTKTPIPCRSSPRERMNYAPTPTKTPIPCRSSPRERMNYAP
jgi:hypothetical protein